MNNYKQLNNVFGWLSFLIASVTYILTIEPSVSFWDCGEFISTSNKLLVGHPPGAPFFMIVGRLFTLFAGDPTGIAATMNIMSALCSGFTIMFLFWTITHFAKKIYLDNTKEEEHGWRSIAVVAAGFVGALAYTFSDTFWFSAVEGEVYAMSSLFTAVVFWAILKWENVADTPYANRWIVFIAFLMGLSIGVHLLNLLTIPALVLVYYFKKYTPTSKGVFRALILSGVILLGILYGIIPYTVKIGSWFELLFVNGFELPYHTGLAVYLIILVSALAFGLIYTYKRRKYVANTIILCITVILMGYSSFAMIMIRSAANPTMDQNSPEDVFSMMGYLNREQYGNRPLFSGQYYNSPMDVRRIQQDRDNWKPSYIMKDGKYEVSGRTPTYYYVNGTTTLFPRMYSPEKRHVDEYVKWAGNSPRNTKKYVDPQTNSQTPIDLPSFGENLKFFFKYQVNYMYFRYFMWNFAGRQNDIQGNGELTHGNWISGIPLIDNMRLGDQSKLPDYLKNNKANNKYYFLPLLLGLFGLVFQFLSGKKGEQGFSIVLLLFFLTGLAIVIYLNQTPLQPRERDYAYAASFYAFAIWIGMGVLPMIDGLRLMIGGKSASIFAGVICLIAVPINMAAQNWDDHDRSHRLVAHDLAEDYLQSCGDDAIIFTNGDNDTFPLWYSQEVEGFRTDVRVCNLSYLQTDWYVDQMKRKAYDSDPLPISFTHDEYVSGTIDAVRVADANPNVSMDFKDVAKALKKDVPTFPTSKFYIPLDSAQLVDDGVVKKENAALINDRMDLSVSNNSTVYRNKLMIYDMMRTNNWKRPIYYAVTVSSDNFAGLEPYFSLEGLAYRVSPVKLPDNTGGLGHVNTEVSYDFYMNKFKWGGYNDPRVYLDEQHRRMGMNILSNVSRVASALIREGKKEEASKLLKHAVTMIPPERVNIGYFGLSLAQNFYLADSPEEGAKIIIELSNTCEQELKFYDSLSNKKLSSLSNDIRRSNYIWTQSLEMLKGLGQTKLHEQLYKNYVSFSQSSRLFRKEPPKGKGTTKAAK